MIFRLEAQETEPESESPKASTKADEAKSSPEKASGSASETVVVSPDDLEPLLQRQCKIWQRRLKLADWNVLVRLCRLNEMGRDCVGAIQIYIESKDAVMLLLSPSDLPLIAEHFIDEQANYDLTIVHELLHLHFAPFQEDDETPKGIAQEQAINQISRCILAAYTKKGHRSSTPGESPKVGHYL